MSRKTASIISGILVLLALFVVPAIRGAGEAAKIDLAKAMVGPSGTISNQLELFYQRMNRYPERLADLYERPDYVEEDDEKFVLVLPYCGSGGRMQKEGKVGSTRKAYPWSFDQEGVSYYCCHEGVFNQVFEELGFGNMKFEYCPQFDKEGKPTGDVCRCVIYKKKP